MANDNENSNAAEKKQPTPVQKAFQRKVKRETYLTSGFESARDKNRMIDLFYTEIWPQLQELGWDKLEDDSKIIFQPADKSASLDRIIDIFSHIKHNASSNEELMNMAAEIAKTASENDDKGEDDLMDISDTENVSGAPKTPTKRHARQLPKSKKPSNTPTSPDMSWKDGGREFPKRCSQIGPQHQATRIPKAGSYTDKRNESTDEYTELAWSPKQAEEKGLSMDAVDALLADVPARVKEAALFLLASKDYDVAAFQQAVPTLKPREGSDWGPTRKKRFVTEIYQKRKDFVAMAKAMRLPIQTVYAYYLAHFKFSDDYRLLKTIIYEEYHRVEGKSDYEKDACAICGDGGNLLICDGCEAEYHMECLRPPLQVVPEGHWECDECVDRKFLTVRDFLVRKTSMFRPIETKANTEAEGEKMADDDTKITKKVKTRQGLYEPEDEVRHAVRKMALTINEAFARKGKQPLATEDLDM